jgi:NAD(P)-dependent dehydrogenase (short-subunit alcohol dehydrogenase family)
MPRVLITGANRGLGLEFARQYSADGWDVIATARNPKQSEELDRLAQSKRVSLQALDVTSDDSVKHLAEVLNGTLVDLLILNSAIFTRDGNKLGELDFTGWRESFETNVLGAMRVAQALIQNVAASIRKQIVAISTGMGSMESLATTIGFGSAYQYRSSKAALNMAMSILAKDLEPLGISVLIFSPGWVQTDMGGPNAALTPEQSIAGMRKVLEGNPVELTGKFLSYDGSTWPWELEAQRLAVWFVGFLPTGIHLGLTTPDRLAGAADERAARLKETQPPTHLVRDADAHSCADARRLSNRCPKPKRAVGTQVNSVQPLVDLQSSGKPPRTSRQIYNFFGFAEPFH